MSAFIDILAAVACLVCAIVLAKRIGGAAPWLIAAVAALDALIVALFRGYVFVRDMNRPSLGYSYFDDDPTLRVLQMLDVLATYTMGIVMLVAFWLLMPKTVRR